MVGLGVFFNLSPFHSSIKNRMLLLDGTVLSTNSLLDGKVPSTNSLLDGTVPSTNSLLDETLKKVKV